jgi:hypothetical protein
MNYIFEIWQEENKEILQHLYKVFVNISYDYNMDIFENNKSYNYFLQMMYCNSTKEIVRDF